MPPPASGGNEDDEVEPNREEADPSILYQQHQDDRGYGYLAPRLIVCDIEENFGSLGTSGLHGSRYGGGAEGPPMDPLSWGGGVTQVVHEPRAVHKFNQMMIAPVLQQWGDEGADGYGDGYGDGYDDGYGGGSSSYGAYQPDHRSPDHRDRRSSGARRLVGCCTRYVKQLSSHVAI